MLLRAIIGYFFKRSKHENIDKTHKTSTKLGFPYAAIFEIGILNGNEAMKFYNQNSDWLNF
jgi:hypothetical protein